MEIGGTFARYGEIGGQLALWLVVACAVLALALIVERAIAVRRARINVNEFLAKVRKALIVSHSLREAVKISEEYRSPVASIVKTGLLKYGRPRSEVEEAIAGAAHYETGRLERGLLVLATTARVVPLLGFLGTILAAIAAFDALADAGAALPGGGARAISEALVAAALGLLVAIPVQIAYNYFVSRVNKFGRDIETATNVLFETLTEMERSDAAPEPAGGQTAGRAAAEPVATGSSGSRSAGKVRTET